MNMHNKNDANRFLRFLDSDAETFVFQTYDEGEKEDGEKIPSSLSDGWDTLVRKNASGHAISVTVNETNGKDRTAESVTRVRAVWQEDDDGYGDDFPLPPSLTVTTSPGKYHRYWLVEGDWPADAEGREDFRRVMRSMVKDYGSDPNAKDISRVLRLPGTLHQKNEPHPVRITWDNQGNPERYTREKIVAAFAKPDDKPVSAPKAPSDRSCPPVDQERLLDALASIPSDDRDDWLTVGMALHHEFDGTEEGFAIWDDWSRGTKAGNYDPEDQHRTWNSFRDSHGNPTTIGTVFHRAKENGWQDQTGTAPLPVERIDIERHPGDLAERAIEAVKQFFADGNKSNPSADHYDGMEEIAKVIQAMAEGDESLGRDFLVSSLPTGIGKTTTVRETIREIVRTPDYDDVGVVVFLSRVEEIEKLVAGMGLEENQFATVVSQNYQDKVPPGNPLREEARVLFTTQQMLSAHLKGKDCFADIREFHFAGKPRQVRIWDEGVSPSDSLVLGQWDITNLYKGLISGGHEKLVMELRDLSDTIEGADDHAIVQIPDIESFKVGMEDARSLFNGDGDRKAVEVLWKLSGRAVRIRKGHWGKFAIDYEDVFPDDLGPLLVGTVRNFVREAMMMRRRIIAWQSMRNYWTVCSPAATRTRCFLVTVCSTI